MVRYIASIYFYDPFIAYFKNDYLSKGIPEIEEAKYFSFLSLRYWLNAIFSLAIIYVLFRSKKILGLSIKIFVISFFLLLGGFLLVMYSQQEGYLLLFYIRRFLIHPMLLLLLVPAFYYKKVKI